MLLRFALAGLAAWVFTLSSSPALAVVIDSSAIIPITGGESSSGNGTLDYILLTESAGGSGNSSGAFDGDDANTGLPTGNGNTTANESYITSIGEIREFYRITFPDGGGGSTVNQIVVFVDVNQTGGDQHITLDTLDIIQDYTANFGDDRDNPAGADIASSVQNSTNAGFSGGTLLANLDSSKTIAYQNNGAGHADAAILTGIDPFSGLFSDSTRILFHWTSSDHDDGGETVFLSGEIGPQDLIGIPEPSILSLAGVAGVGLLASGRKRAVRLV